MGGYFLLSTHVGNRAFQKKRDGGRVRCPTGQGRVYQWLFASHADSPKDKAA